MTDGKLESFGVLHDGATVEAVTLHSAAGLSARILTYGATLQALEVPDRQGVRADVVLGHATLAEYVERPQYFGATVGRYANRIRDGRFSLDGREHQIPPVDGEHALHGGRSGFDKRNWTIAEHTPSRVSMYLRSQDGEEGFPGNLDVEASYELTDDNALILKYVAQTDAPTVVNITNHSYFNLCGEGRRDALDHVLTLFADHVTAVDRSLIPTGDIAPIAGTPLDFRSPRRISDAIREAGHPQIACARGYDFNYVLRGDPAGVGHRAARLEDPITGRVLSIETTESGIQFYSGNFLDATTRGKAGRTYRQGDGIALETQHFPDSPNHPHFPSTCLDPGVTWRSTTVWRFTTSEPE